MIAQESTLYVIFTGSAKWWFPEIGLPQEHPYFNGIFHYKPTIFWMPPFMETLKSGAKRQQFQGQLSHPAPSDPENPGFQQLQAAGAQLGGQCHMRSLGLWGAFARPRQPH